MLMDENEFLIARAKLFISEFSTHIELMQSYEKGSEERSLEFDRATEVQGKLVRMIPSLILALEITSRKQHEST